MFLGFARGKVGDAVFTRIDGEQVTRARNRSPKNPKSIRQCVNRSILKTSSQAYSVFAPICDHSFEGYAQGTPNQSQFTKLNTAYLRGIIEANALDLNDPSTVLASQLTNFATRQTTYALMNPYILSSGQLPVMRYAWITGSPKLFANMFTTTPTYQDVVDGLGLERGDQLTFIWTYGDDSAADGMAGCITGIRFARVILEPSDGDMSGAFYQSSPAGVKNPNPRNTGKVFFTFADTGQITFTPGDVGVAGDATLVTGIAVIVSRKIGSVWRRSAQILTPRPGLENDPDSWFLGDAVASFQTQDSGSSLYLNQAENF